MGRIRSIKPEFFKHEALYDLEKESGLPLRVAYAGLWTACDREGRFVWRPRTLKTDVLPYDDVDFADVLDWLERGGFITRYEVNGQVYGCVPSWRDHQHINNKEQTSSIPDPRVNDACATRAPRVNDAWVGMHGGKGKGKEGKGREGEGRVATRERVNDDASEPNPPHEAIAPIVSHDVPPNDATHHQCATWFWERMLQAADKGMFSACSETIRLEARQRNLPPNAIAIEILARAKIHRDEFGAVIDRFYFTDGKFRLENGGANGKRAAPYDSRTKAQRDFDATVAAVEGAKRIARGMAD